MTGYTMKRVLRQQWKAVPIGSLLESSLVGCATLALVRIQNVRRTRGCGCWLFVDPEGRVFVLSDEASALPAMQREHADWLVGYYREPEAKRGAPPMVTLADLQDAIVAHMAGSPLKLEDAHAA